MDIDGYPEKSELRKIAQWGWNDISVLMDYVEERWKYADIGYFRKGRKYYYLSTTGWSGNESIIEALRKNTMFWMMYWQSSKRGGHYVFKVKR